MEKIAFNVALLCYLAGSLEYFVYLVYRKPAVQVAAKASVAAGLFFHTIAMGIHSIATGHGPYTNASEAAMFVAWLMVVIYTCSKWRYHIKDLGAFVIPLVFLIMMSSAFSSPGATAPVTETEGRFWLTMHRALSIMGYAAFAVSFAVGIMYLIQERQVKSKKLGIMYFRMPSLEVLDDLNYKIIAIGFPLFTLGFMTGSIWSGKAHHVWLSWNLAKTWPLMAAWVVYCVVFFGHMFAGLRGKKLAQGAIIGFITVVLTYFLHI